MAGATMGEEKDYFGGVFLMCVCVCARVCVCVMSADMGM